MIVCRKFDALTTLTPDTVEQARAASAEMNNLTVPDMPAGWKLQYVEALKKELEKPILTIVAQPSH